MVPHAYNTLLNVTAVETDINLCFTLHIQTHSHKHSSSGDSLLYSVLNILNFFFNNFIYFGLCWVLIAAQAFLQLWQAGATLSLRWLLLSWSTGSQGAQASVAVMHRLSRSMACGIFLDRGLNPCLLHWQLDSLPLSHQGNPKYLKKCLNQILINVWKRMWC